MNWLRENWFDALLFVLLAAVVVAIVLFLVGVNPFAKPTVAPAPKPPPPAVETPAPAQTAENPPAPAAPETEKPSEGGGEVTVLPLPPVGGSETPSAPANPTLPSAAPSPAPRPAATPAPGGRYRVSVGAFTRPEYAIDLARKMEAEGYPVRIEVIGRISRVVVGPYPSRDRAEAVAEKLKTYEPQVYKGDTPEPKGDYLQVAAFKELARARKVAKALKDQGFPVAVYYRDGWAKVWVGPLEAEKLEPTKAELKAKGYAPVEVRGGQG